MVDVFITTHNEKVELLYKVITGLKMQTYPAEFVNIYLCDDGKKVHGMEELASGMNINYLKLENNNEHKAGNLNNALKHSNSPYIITVDADMIANENAIEVLVSNIEKNPELAFVQSPQSFYNPDMFRFNLFAEKDFPDEQSFFFKVLNPLKSFSSTSLYCGSNTILRRSALDNVGGLATDSLTEDFATAIKFQRKDWKSKAISQTLFNGLAPYTIAELMKQRKRWSRGCFQTLKNNNFFLSRDFSLIELINNLSTVNYWFGFFSKFFYLTLPLLVVFFGLIPTTISSTAIILLWAPMYILVAITTRYVSQNTRGLIYSDLVGTIQCFTLTEAFFKEMIKIPIKFEITSKIRPFRLKKFNKFGIPHIIYLILSIVALLLYFILNMHYWIVLFWILANIFILSISILFFIDRQDKYNEDIFPINEKILINNKEYIPKYFSDSGIYIKNYKINENPINIEISNNEYEGKIEYIKSNETYIKINFKNKEEYNNYLFFIYNREEFFKTASNMNILKIFVKNIKEKFF